MGIVVGENPTATFFVCLGAGLYRILMLHTNNKVTETLTQFFHRVTRKEILPYQERYGTDPFSSTLMIIPTGLGKTEAVLIPWLHAVATGRAGTPRRLVFIQPRQNLTEQTVSRARELVKAAGLQLRVFQLMGGSRDNNDLTLGPDEFVIIVGTQDLILSRALNRGYARRPPRWPIDFALLNNDALWVIDEVQLTSDGLGTSTQLAAFRKSFGVFGHVPCVWMSATVDPAWLDTVDYAETRPSLCIIKLEAADSQNEIVRRRLNAQKDIARAPEKCCTPKGCAEFALTHHKSGERTLVVVNTVARAREICQELAKVNASALLLHSRFRPADRKKKTEALTQGPSPDGQIVVSTQVLEAGVDITANRLVTDVASWGSLVQRFGRVNRYGDLSAANIWWVDQPITSKKTTKEENVYAPYALDEVKRAVDKLDGLASASPSQLPSEDGPPPYSHVLRRSDLLDLFDTSSDISGNELDISRFIRSGEDNDCYICWRNWKSDDDLQAQREAKDDELCPVPIGEIKEFLKKKHELYAWSFATKGWFPVSKDQLHPGQILITHTREGGYSQELGWSPDSKQPVDEVFDVAPTPAEGDGDDFKTWIGYRQTLTDHTNMVVAALEELLTKLDDLGLAEFRPEMQVAAQKHDWGKAHRVMQDTLHEGDPSPELLAKSKNLGRHAQQHFRHELGSALAMLVTGESDLAAYIAAAHHGRIRVSIRSMTGETEQMGKRLARGIHEGDPLPECELASEIRVPAIGLSLDVMGIGIAPSGAISWTDRVIRLRDELGPFRLAYLEMLLRIADERASEKARLACTQ